MEAVSDVLIWKAEYIWLELAPIPFNVKGLYSGEANICHNFEHLPTCWLS